MTSAIVETLEGDDLFQATRAATRVRPYFLARVAGLPAATLMDLTTSRCREHLRQLLALEDAARIPAAQLTECLYALVSNANDQEARRALLAVRREAFNLRCTKRHAWDAVQTMLSGDDQRTCSQLRQYLEAAHQEKEALRESAREAMHHGRVRLRQHVRDEDFLKGLLLSSPELFDAATRWQRRPADATTSKDRMTERGLLRYLTRMAGKATPFGRFCVIVPGTLTVPSSNDTQSSQWLTASPQQKMGEVRLNKEFFGVIWECAKHDPDIRAYLPIEINRTLIADGEGWRLLTSKNGQEVFHRVQPSAAVAKVLNVLEAHRDTTYGALADAIAQDPRLDTTRDATREFLDALLSLGALRFRAPVGDQTLEWVEPTLAMLRNADADGARTMATLLEKLSEIAAAYGDATSDQRWELSRTVHALMADAAPVIGTAARAMRLPYFEDATAPCVLHINPCHVERAFEALAVFVTLTAGIAFPRDGQAEMRHFFDLQYGSGDVSVPLLRFYEDFYRSHQKDYLTRRRDTSPREPGATGATKAAGNPFNLEVVHRRRLARQRIAMAIQDAWKAAPDAEEINLSVDQLRSFVAGVPVAVGDCGAASVFCQLVDAGHDGHARLLVPQGRYAHGYGKYFSRFLRLLPAAWQEMVRRDNEALTDGLLAELVSDSHFNGNLHPPLVEGEVGYPTSESAPRDGQIAVADIVVRPHPTDPHALALESASRGRRVLPVDLGFLSSMRRPELFQLLIQFAPGASFQLPLPDTTGDSGSGDMPPHGQAKGVGVSTVLCRPRVTFDDVIVLARRSWFVEPGGAPMPHAGEEESDFFLRVNQWRFRCGIPDQCYVRLLNERPRHAESVVTGETNARGRGDLHKPQFMDFANPLLVQLFGRVVHANPGQKVVVEECYPAHDMASSHDNVSFVSELVIEVERAETGTWEQRNAS